MTTQDWDEAPCGLLTLHLDGTVRTANATFLGWVGREYDALVGCGLSDVLSVGGRIYWETHLSPLLHVEGGVEEVAVELRTPSGRMPVLLTAVRDGDALRVAVGRARERARYERELLAARSAADLAAAQLRALQQTTAALSRSVGVDAIAAALLAASTQALGAASASLWLANADGTLVPAAGAADGPALPEAGAVLQERVATVAEGRVVVPLHGTTRLQGVLSLTPRETGAADPLDLELMTAVGQQAGLALDRAHLYEQSADVARELQHSLLAVDLPDDPRFAVAGAYRPGVELLEVGGDWFDVFLSVPDLLSVVVGDVVGRGLRAASAMGQLRSAVRALAGTDSGPGGLLSRLDRFVDQVESAAMATVAYAELDLHTGRLRYACAGHPPPLLLPVEGPARLLWDGRSTPLGSFGRPEQRGDADLQLAPGDRLLLCTDGLFERRDRDLDVGLDLLAEVATGLGGLPLTTAVSELTRTLLLDEVVRDDVCVLMLSWPGPPFDRDLPADLTTLGAVRRELGAWLDDSGADERTVQDVVLATSEAIANAAEHGAGGRSTEHVLVHAQREQRPDEPDELVVSVRDEGRWRAGVASSDRGRGLTIIRALVDHVSIDDRDGTTVVLRHRIHREAS